MSATATLDIDQITLTTGQLAALDAFFSFLMDPTETVFVLEGYSGCGKSTLVRILMDRLPAFMKTVRLINPNQPDLEVALTATTNKAAENLANITGMDVSTIHTFLGLRVVTDWKTSVTTLVPKNQEVKEGFLVLIDEASFIDSPMLRLVFSRTKNCKIVFIGDPAQLTQVKASGAPVFEANFRTAALTEVVRQPKFNNEPHPIEVLSEKFRHAVTSGEFFSFKPDGHFIKHLPRADFNAAIEAEFTRPDWKYSDSKVLAWTNKCAIGYNHYINNLMNGNPSFQVNEYAVCNSFLQLGNRMSIKTDQLVQITHIGDPCEQYDVPGTMIEMDNTIVAFQPNSLADKNARIKRARAEGDIAMITKIETSWVDLRAAQSCTVNKSQGSTYGTVFLDLDDIARCNSGNQIARMMYVGCSRAKNFLYLTGDLA